MKTIIIPTDFSLSAAAAMQYAAGMAQEINASVLLLHVYQIPVTVSDMPVVIIPVEELKANAEEQLKQVKNQLENDTGRKIKIYTEAILGNTVDELEELGKRINPFAIVLGSQGATGMERILFGSTTLTAIRHLTWPVIVVHSGSKYNGIKKIGFACDFRKVVETTPTQYIKEVVNTFKAELHVLNINAENSQLKPQAQEEALLLHTLLEELNPSYHFIKHADMEEGINSFADENNIDLIITIPKKHTLLEGLFKKSSTRQIIYQSHVPIMCVHE